MCCSKLQSDRSVAPDLLDNWAILFIPKMATSKVFKSVIRLAKVNSVYGFLDLLETYIFLFNVTLIFFLF